MKRFGTLALACCLAGCASVPPNPGDGLGQPGGAIRFEDVTEAAGLSSPRSWKYGGPLVADLDGDGHLDLILGNHDEHPPLLYWGLGEGRFTPGILPDIYRDVHGLAPGDYDGDGDLDLLVAVGGGNGTSPRPPILLRNDGRRFIDATEQSGLKGIGARGRSVRWVDLDSDGDLDILAISAIQLPGETGPRNFAFENRGDGTFTYRPTGQAFEKAEAERLLLTDYDNDGKLDFVTFSPLAIWRNVGDFTFRDVSAEVLPAALVHAPFVTAAAEADIDNDGDFDLYVARGKVYYEIADNAVSFAQETGRLDLRDEGNKSRDGICFAADGTVGLRDFWHWRRGKDISLPVYLGAAGTRIDTPEEPVTVQPEEAEGLPASLDRDGWYLSHVGDGRWRLAWNLSDDLAWDIRASVTGVREVMPDWEPNRLGVQDLLLRNDGGRFADSASLLPPGSADNNWGVTPGDFDNDGRIDFFVHRFGELRQRLPDHLFRNSGPAFTAVTDHGATTETGNSHGDMGAALDADGDGWIDLLNGDDDTGYWHLYRNRSDTASGGAWTLVDVGRSGTGVDAQQALVVVTTDGGVQRRRIASAGEVHTQSVINPVHFGLGEARRILQVKVIWRDGSEKVLTEVPVGRRIRVEGGR